MKKNEILDMIHKIREKMSRLSIEERRKEFKEAEKEYRKLIAS
jgi:hypothetical protein